MQQSININISPEELRNIIKDSISEELQVVNNVLSSLMISASEAKIRLGIKSHNTLMSYVRDGLLINYAKGNEHPKFSLSEVIELIKTKKPVKTRAK